MVLKFKTAVFSLSLFLAPSAFACDSISHESANGVSQAQGQLMWRTQERQDRPSDDRSRPNPRRPRSVDQTEVLALTEIPVP